MAEPTMIEPVAMRPTTTLRRSHHRGTASHGPSRTIDANAIPKPNRSNGKAATISEKIVCPDPPAEPEP
jgi:hypothetical protein